MIESGEHPSFGVSLRLSDLWKGPVGLFTAPRRFFTGMAKAGGFVPPLVFALCWLFAATAVELAVSQFRPPPAPVSAAVKVGWLAVGPALLLVVGFVFSGILHGIWRLMGSREKYETAFRCWAYMTPLSVVGAVLSAVAYLNLVSFFWGLALLAGASQSVHGLSRRKSWGVWGGVGAVMAVWGFLAVRFAPPPESSAPIVEELRDTARELSEQIE